MYLHDYVCLMQESTEDSNKDEFAIASDLRGVNGWDKVDALLAMTNEQARSSRSLYNALEDYDKRTLMFSPQQSPRKMRGHFDYIIS